MRNVLLIAFFLSLGMTVVSLVAGLIGFFFNTPFYKAHANAFMQARVLFQAITLGLLALLFWTS